MAMRRVLIVLSGLLLAGAAPEPTLDALLVELNQADSAGRAADGLTAIRKLVERVPDHPWLVERHARLAAVAGEEEEAMKALRRLEAMRATSDMANADLARLRSNPEFKALAERITANGREQGTARPAFSLATPGLVVEGMARDPATGELLFADMHAMRIVRRSAAGQERAASLPAEWNISGVLGLKPDPGRGRLWVCAARREGTGERAVLLLLRLETLAPERIIDFPADGGEHLCNDMDILGDGRVAVTDSAAGRVWLGAAEGRLAPVVAAGTFHYPNGIAVAADGRRAYVASTGGVDLLDTATGSLVPLVLADGQSRAGVDGLYRRGDVLVAIQNGFQPARVVTIKLGDDGTRGVLTSVAAASPLFELPTTGAIDEEGLLLIANAQFRKVEKGRLKDGETLQPIRVLRVPL
jgi:hypothetical protein